MLDGASCIIRLEYERATVQPLIKHKISYFLDSQIRGILSKWSWYKRVIHRLFAEQCWAGAIYVTNTWIPILLAALKQYNAISAI